MKGEGGGVRRAGPGRGPPAAGCWIRPRGLVGCPRFMLVPIAMSLYTRSHGVSAAGAPLFCRPGVEKTTADAERWGGFRAGGGGNHAGFSGGGAVCRSRCVRLVRWAAGALMGIAGEGAALFFQGEGFFCCTTLVPLAGSRRMTGMWIAEWGSSEVKPGAGAVGVGAELAF